MLSEIRMPCSNHDTFKDPYLWLESANPARANPIRARKVDKYYFPDHTAPYPWGNYNSFVPDSAPDSNLYNGDRSNLYLTNITTTGTFTYKQGYDVTTTVPNLTHSNDTFALNKVAFSATGFFPARVYVVLKKYDGSNVTTSPVQAVTINDAGKGAYNPPASLNQFNHTEQIEILIYGDSTCQNLINRQFVHPNNY